MDDLSTPSEAMDDQPTPSAASDDLGIKPRAERRALSREIHDDIAHLILIVMYTLDRAELHHDAWEPAARRLIRDARETAAVALEKARRLAARLRDGADDHQVSTVHEPSGDLSTELSYVLREAVVNALAHAEAWRVVVDIKQSVDHIIAVVEDDGIGFEPERLAPRDQVGLLSMRERAALIGGQLHIDTALDQGTRVTIRMPCENASRGGR